MKPKPLNFSIKKMSKKSVATFLWLSMSLFLATARLVLKRVGITEGIFRETVLVAVTCIPFVYLMTGLHGTSGKKVSVHVVRFWGLYFVVVLVFLISLLLNPRLSEYYFRQNYGIGPVFRPDGALYAVLFFSLFDDPIELRKVLVKSAYILFFFQIVVVFLPVLRRGYWIDIAPQGGEMHIRYSLSFGYDLIFPLTIFFTEGLKKHKIRYFAFAFACAILIITNGGRGALASLLLFFVLLAIITIIDSQTSFNKKFFIIVGAIFLGLIYLFFIDDILIMLINILTKQNINSRTLEMIINGTLSADNGRGMIWNAVIDAISQSGPFGYGLFGDRPFVVPYHIAGYSHNLFLELLSNFGIVGAGIIIYLVVDVVRMIFFCKDKNWRLIYVILLTCSFKLMLSFSLWYAWEFWAATAVAYKYKVLKKKNSRLYVPASHLNSYRKNIHLLE